MFMNKRQPTPSVTRSTLVLGLLITFVFYINVALFNFEGAVICVGDDGHLAIETVEANQHLMPQPFAPAPEWTGQVLVDDSCQDVPIPRVVSSTYLPGKTKGDVALPVILTTIDYDQQRYPRWQWQPLEEIDNLPNSVQSMIQTTVLLI